MTIRQRLLKMMYPAVMRRTKGSSKGLVLTNADRTPPAVSFYSLKARDMKGREVSFEQYRGKKVMLVNVASNCGYTGQYDALEKLHQQNKKNLVILGFPANNFGGQEPGKDAEIENFCRVNFGVSFPLFQKSSVLKPEQNAVFEWLSDPSKNGWNRQLPNWNFCKYVVDEKGVLTNFFGSAVDPESEEVKKAI